VNAWNDCLTVVVELVAADRRTALRPSSITGDANALQEKNMDFESAFQAKQAVATLLGIGGPHATQRGRVAVGVALTAEPGDFRIAIRARSQQDLNHALGQGMDDTVRRITASELDVRITGPIAGGPSRRASPSLLLRIGASISHHLFSTGTLGFFARRSSDCVVGIVSNNHVLSGGDRGKENDEIVHPGEFDHAVRHGNVIAYLAPGYPRLDVRKPVVDCAFARLRDGIPYDPVTIAKGLKLNPDPVILHEQRDVMKYGRTTGLTHGRITAIALDNVHIDYEFGDVCFNEQIEIEPKGDTPFSRPGDSGSLVVSPDGHPVGLLCAGTHTCHFSYANPIAEVLSSLGITVLI
jgi:hypothetical protein